MRYFLMFIVCEWLLGSTPSLAQTRKEILEICGRVAKEAAKAKLMEDEHGAKLTQRTTWLSGYEPIEKLSPIFTVLMDFTKIDDSSGYVAYKVTTTYDEKKCKVVEIEKEPL